MLYTLIGLDLRILFWVMPSFVDLELVLGDGLLGAGSVEASDDEG